MPLKARLLNDGSGVHCLLDRPAFDAHLGRDFLRLHDLPVEQFANEVIVVRLDFETLPERIASNDLKEDRI